jgi:arginine N-succinyltransferase
MHRSDFRDELLAELLPPLEADGTSHLWEAIGRHFTELTYREADRLSKKNKEFIKTLWPDGDIYASLLSEQAQSVIGKVGPQTKGVEKLLRRIGFRYADRIDPFDGGPHFVADTDEVLLVQRSRRAPASIAGDAAVPPSQRALVARERDDRPYFTAVVSNVVLDPAQVTLPTSIAQHLGVNEGDPVWVLPLE